MGIFSRLFGKKDEAGLEDSSLNLEEQPIIPEAEEGQELPPHLTEPEAPLSPSMPSQPSGAITSRDVELINSKLDTLKAILNSMDQRIAHLEKAAGVEQKKMPW